MCEDIGVAMVTSIILLAWLANYKRASHSGAWSVLLKFHSQNGFEMQRWDSYRWLSRWAAKFSHSFPELEEHSGRFVEVSESDESHTSQESTTWCYFKICFCCHIIFLFFIRILTFWNRKYKYYCLYFSFMTLYPFHSIFATGILW